MADHTLTARDVQAFTSVSFPSASPLLSVGVGEDLELSTAVTTPDLFPWKNVVKVRQGEGVPDHQELEVGEFAISTDTGEMWTKNVQEKIVRVGGLYWSAATQRPTTKAPGGGFSHISDGKDGTSLPTSDPELDGAFWNDNGVLKVSDG